MLRRAILRDYHVEHDGVALIEQWNVMGVRPPMMNVWSLTILYGPSSTS